MYFCIFINKVSFSGPDQRSILPVTVAISTRYRRQASLTLSSLVPSSQPLTLFSSQTSQAWRGSCTLTCPQGTSLPWIFPSLFIHYFGTLAHPDPYQPHEPAPWLVLNPASPWFPPALILEETANEWPWLMHCTHDLIDPSGQVTLAWYLRRGQLLPSPATCHAMHGPAEGLPSSCHGAQWQHGHGRVVFCPLPKHYFPKVFYFLSGLFNLHVELVRARK